MEVSPGINAPATQRRPSPAGRAARRLPLFAGGVTRETVGCMAMLGGFPLYCRVVSTAEFRMRATRLCRCNALCRRQAHLAVKPRAYRCRKEAGDQCTRTQRNKARAEFNKPQPRPLGTLESL